MTMLCFLDFRAVKKYLKFMLVPLLGIILIFQPFIQSSFSPFFNQLFGNRDNASINDVVKDLDFDRTDEDIGKTYTN